MGDYIFNILFGNVDNHGNLEEDEANNEIKNYVSTLKHFDILKQTFIDNLDLQPSDQDQIIGNLNAPDYSNISISSDDEEEFKDVEKYEFKVFNENALNLKMPLKDQLAPLIPKELANIDIKYIFPNFKYDEILRFNKLFGLGKPSSLPKIWRNFYKRRKKLLHNYQQNLNGSNLSFSEDIKNLMTQEGMPFLESQENKVEIEKDEEIEFSSYCTVPSTSTHHPTLYIPNNMTPKRLDENIDNDLESTSSSEQEEEKNPLFNFYKDIDPKAIEEGLYDPLSTVEWEKDIIIDSSLILGDDLDPITGKPSNQIMSAQYVKAKLGITEQDERYCGWLPTATIRSFQASLAHRQSITTMNSSSSSSRISPLGTIHDACNASTNNIDNLANNLSLFFGLSTCTGQTFPTYGLTTSMGSVSKYLKNRPNLLGNIGSEGGGGGGDQLAEMKFIPILSNPYLDDPIHEYFDDVESDEFWAKNVVLNVEEFAKANPHLVNAEWPPRYPDLMAKSYPPPPDSEEASHYMDIEIVENVLTNAANDSYYYATFRMGTNNTSSLIPNNMSTFLNDLLNDQTSSIQLPHGTPASELWPAFYPTFMGPIKLKNFHRPIVKRYSHGLLSTESIFHNNQNQARIAALNAAMQNNNEVDKLDSLKLISTIPTIEGDIFHAVNSVEDRVIRLRQQREKERLALGGGDMFFMHAPSDLSALDGELVLAEYCEEYPPLIMNFGMATAIKNYHKRKPGKEVNVQEFEHGTPAFSQNVPFLGYLAPGQRLQAIENNMYKAPVYLHTFPMTDFLIIRTRNGYFIRTVRDIFTVGQECPLIEVPCPNSKKANQFLRDFLHVFLMRLFRASQEKPPRVYMEQVKRAFPTIAENLLRKKLKSFADFDAGPESGRDSPISSLKSSKKHLSKKVHSSSSKLYGNEMMTKRFQKRFRVWTLRPDFRIPPEEELRELVRPEHACAWYSGLAAESRLLDAGYSQAQIQGLANYNYNPVTGNTTLTTATTSSQPLNEDGQIEEEEEIKAAPWNTTRAFVCAMRGKCLLDLNGVADPTGCGQGFSYVRISGKSRDSDMPLMIGASSSSSNNYITSNGSSLGCNNATTTTGSITPGGYVSKKSVTGTDADLRKLSLKDAKQLLRNFNVPEQELQKLTRWEIIDVVRTLSTQHALLGNDSVTKFARGQKLSATETHEKFKEECQRLFDLQNRVLASNEILSTDEGSTSEDSDFEQMGKNIENMLANHKSKKTANSTSISSSSKPISTQANKSDTTKKETKKDKHQSMSDRKLRITRKFSNPEGHEFVRIETVRNPGVIEAYLRIRESKDPELLAYFSRPDESKKQEMLRERRRIIEQLKRLRVKEERQRQRLLFGADMLNEDVTTDEMVKDKETQVMEERKRLRKIHNLEAHFRDLNEQLNRIDGTSKKGEEVSGSDIVDTGLDSKVKCGACGETGHMKTNKICPLYSTSSRAHHNVAMTQEELESLYDIEKVGTLPHNNINNNINTTTIGAMEDRNKININDGHNINNTSSLPTPTGDLINVEGTKIILSKTIIQHYDNVRRKSLILKFPKLSEQHELSKKYRGRKPLDPNKPRKPYTKSAAFYAARLNSNRGRPAGIKKFTGGSKQFFKHQNAASGTCLVNDIKRQRGRPPLSSKSRKSSSSLQTSHSNIPPPPIRDIGALGMFAPHLAEIYSEAVGSVSTTVPSMDTEDYLKKPHQSHKRRAIDPVVTLSSIFETILNCMRDLPNTQPFTHPVNIKIVSDYYQFVHKPMDLQTIRVKIHKRKYKCREDFLGDVSQICENSRIYNGPTHPYTLTAEAMLELCVAKLAEREDKFMKLEKAINPLLDENDAVALGFIFESLVREKLLSNPKYWPFHNPVNPKVLKDYHLKVSNPIDLSTIAKKCKNLSYTSRESFLKDIKRITTNSEMYNGPDSTYTEVARQIYQDTLDELSIYEGRVGTTNITQLEDNIVKAQENLLTQQPINSQYYERHSNDGELGLEDDITPSLQGSISNLGSHEQPLTIGEELDGLDNHPSTSNWPIASSKTIKHSIYHQTSNFTSQDTYFETEETYDTENVAIIESVEDNPPRSIINTEQDTSTYDNYGNLNEFFNFSSDQTNLLSQRQPFNYGGDMEMNDESEFGEEEKIEEAIINNLRDYDREENELIFDGEDEEENKVQEGDISFNNFNDSESASNRDVQFQQDDGETMLFSPEGDVTFQSATKQSNYSCLAEDNSSNMSSIAGGNLMTQDVNEDSNRNFRQFSNQIPSSTTAMMSNTLNRSHYFLEGDLEITDEEEIGAHNEEDEEEEEVNEENVAHNFADTDTQTQEDDMDEEF